MYENWNSDEVGGFIGVSFVRHLFFMVHTAAQTQPSFVWAAWRGVSPYSYRKRYTPGRCSCHPPPAFGLACFWVSSHSPKDGTDRHYVSFYIMWVRTVCWEAGRYPKARWSESWRQEIGTSIGSISLSATTRENAMPCYSNGGRRSLRYCISRNRFQWHLSSGYSKNLNAIVSNKTITFVISNLEIKWKIFNISYRKKKSI